MNAKRLCTILAALFALSGLAAQSDTRYDAGLNLPFNEKAGEVNPQTGGITLSVTDVSLHGRAGMDFQFGRVWATAQSNVYSMYRDSVTGENRLNSETVEARTRLGAGWNSSLPLIYDDLSSGEKLQYLFLSGSAYELDMSGMRIKNPQKSNILWYDLLDKRVYEDSSISYGDKTNFVASALASFGVSDASTTRSKYVLIFSDNSKYWFRGDGQVMMQEDRTGMNKIWFYYNSGGKLTLVVDTLERKIRFAYDASGNLASVSWDVTLWTKDASGERRQETEERKVLYGYESLGVGGAYPSSLRLKAQVLGYHTPFALTRVTDPMGHTTDYRYTEGNASFTYNDTRAHASNIYLLLTSITTMAQADGSFLNERIFTYNNTDREETNPQIFRKYFYSGYMEYFKLVGQYARDRNARAMNDTRYNYYDNGKNGNYQCYTTVLEQGNVKTEYKYSISGAKNQDNVLDTLTVNTSDGFTQLTDYTYNSDRTKSLESVFRKGTFAYLQKFQYDTKGRPTRVEDKMGLVTVVEYDAMYGLPIKEYKTFTSGGIAHTYQREWALTPLGQVASETQFFKEGSVNRPVRVASNTYDEYGNLTAVQNALGETSYTEFDSDVHAFPVKIYHEVHIGAWSTGGTVESAWNTNPDSESDIQKLMCIRSWKEYNSDGSVWLEVDNEGYAMEYFYDALGSMIEQVNPNLNDERSFAMTEGIDPPRIATPAFLPSLLASRRDNPGSRLTIDYAHDLVKTTVDIDRIAGYVKTTGVQKDGLGHTEAEIEYDGSGNEYSKKVMIYDTLGRMIALTDPDALPSSLTLTISGTHVSLTDKTWLIRYDDLGRQIIVNYPETEKGRTDRKIIRYNDAENSVTSTDADKRTVYQKKDWNDNVVLVIEKGYGSEASKTYQYTYDALGRKTRFVDPKGITNTYVYNERNLLIEQVYGESGGSDSMGYDDASRLVRKSDRKNQIIAMSYDELGRNTAVTHYASLADEKSNTVARSVRTVYDNRGNPVRITSDKLIEHYEYDPANRVITLDRRLTESSVRDQVATVYGAAVLPQVFSFRYEYNDAGMVRQMTYPTGAVHEFRYDSILGRLEGIDEGSANASLTSFITGLDYNKAGQVTEMRYGNNTRENWTFDSRKRISHLMVTGPLGELENLAYTLSPNGNVLTINENSYAYDGFNQVSTANTKLPENVDTVKLVHKSFGTYLNGDAVNGAFYNEAADLNTDGRINGIDDILSSYIATTDQYDEESFVYDLNGNRTSLIQNGDEYSYEYGLRNQLSKIYLKKKNTAARVLFAEYSYDANGNTLARTLYTAAGLKKTDFFYDTLNRLVRTSEGGKHTDYAYDNAGNRLYKKDSTGMTLYLRHGQIAVAMDIEVYAAASTEGDTDRGTINRYVLSGDLLAGRISTKVSRAGIETVKKSYYHLDHQNSTRAVSDAGGALEVQYIYRAFGEQLRKLGEGDATYTYGGKELDEVTNLYYFNARYYDATTGRFINVDPIQDGSNWYVYCGNNPMNFLDPTGMWTFSIGLTATAFAGLGPKVGSGFTISFSKSEGFGVGSYVYGGGNAGLPAVAGVGVEFSVNPAAASAQDLNGPSVAYGAGVDVVASLGVEVGVNDAGEPSFLENGGSATIGLKGSAMLVEAHISVFETKAVAVTTRDCVEALSNLKQGFENYVKQNLTEQIIQGLQK